MYLHAAAAQLQIFLIGMERPGRKALDVACLPCARRSSDITANRTWRYPPVLDASTDLLFFTHPRLSLEEKHIRALVIRGLVANVQIE